MTSVLDSSNYISGNLISFFLSFGGSLKHQTKMKITATKKVSTNGCDLWKIFGLLELTCVDPGNIKHGERHHDGFESGKKVKYRCLAGFTMEGSGTLTCTRAGIWDRIKPNCTCKRTNKQAFRYCKKSCNPDSSSCGKDKECVCDGDCGYSCVAKGLYFFLNSCVVSVGEV